MSNGFRMFNAPLAFPSLLLRTLAVGALCSSKVFCLDQPEENISITVIVLDQPEENNSIEPTL